MTLPHIDTVRLLPLSVPVFCESPACFKERPQAMHWSVAPDGTAVSRYCEEHAKRALEGLNKIERGWTLAPIFHALPDSIWLPRTGAWTAEAATLPDDCPRCQKPMDVSVGSRTCGGCNLRLTEMSHGDPVA